MNYSDLARHVNDEAARLHVIQGRLMEDGLMLPNKIIYDVIDALTIEYQHNFCSLCVKTIEKATMRGYYIVFPKKPDHTWPKEDRIHIFEVWWMMAGFLGLALARQALQIHKRTKDRKDGEPADCDRRFRRLLHELLRQPANRAVKLVGELMQ